MIENTKRNWLQKRDNVINQEYYNTLAESEEKKKNVLAFLVRENGQQNHSFLHNLGVKQKLQIFHRIIHVEACLGMF